jgi:hypothetical protein
MSDNEVRDIIASAISTARRGNPAMGGPLTRDRMAADKVLDAIAYHGYEIIRAATFEVPE